MQNILPFLTVVILDQLRTLSTSRLSKDNLKKEKLRLWTINVLARGMIGVTKFAYGFAKITVVLPFPSADKDFVRRHASDLEQFRADISTGINNALNTPCGKAHLELIKTLTKKLTGRKD